MVIIVLVIEHQNPTTSQDTRAFIDDGQVVWDMVQDGVYANKVESFSGQAV